MNPPLSGDLTPESSSPTDVAPLGRSGARPPHERTASDEASEAEWTAIANDPEFKKLLSDKARFVIPATIFFLVYYFAMLVLIGWSPSLMDRKVLGEVNIAYLFALSQFFMAWGVAFIYVRAAGGWDKAAAAVLAKFGKR